MNRLQQFKNTICELYATHYHALAPETVQPLPTQNQQSLFVPLHYEKNYSYPLVVWLHSAGDDQRQLKRVMPLMSMRNYVGVAPRGFQSGAEGVLSWLQDEKSIFSAESRVEESVLTAASKFSVAMDRIFLAGYEAGGTMALRLALLRPDRYAGVISIGGPIPQGSSPLVNYKRVRQLRLLLSHGRDSIIYSEQSLCRDLRLMHAAGMSVDVRQYPTDEELTTKMLSDVDAWVMKQVTVQTSADSAKNVASDRLDAWN